MHRQNVTPPAQKRNFTAAVSRRLAKLPDLETVGVAFQYNF